MSKIFADNDLRFTTLFQANPHIFISSQNPLSAKRRVALEDLDPYPCLTFEQGENHSFHFSEELFNTIRHKKSIRVTDRATLFNLVIGLNGYTISTGFLNYDLNGGQGIIAVPLESDEVFEVGWIVHKDVRLSQIATKYLAVLQKIIAEKYQD